MRQREIAVSPALSEHKSDTIPRIIANIEHSGRKHRERVFDIDAVGMTGNAF
jgi:hypothetical protein